LIFAIGLFILAYVLDAVVTPLRIILTTPYNYFTPEIFTRYAFTSTSILIKAVASLLAIILIISSVRINNFVKAGILLLLSGLTQLYTLQSVVTNSQLIPLEWSISLTIASLLLLVPTVIYFIWGVVGLTRNKLTKNGDNTVQEGQVY